MCFLVCDRPLIWLTGCGASRLRLWRPRPVVVRRRSFYSRGRTFSRLFGPPKAGLRATLAGVIMDLTRLAVDAGQFINRAVQVQWTPEVHTLRSMRLKCTSDTKAIRFSRHRTVTLISKNVMDDTKWADDCCHSTPGRLSAKRTRRCWTPAWRRCWPGQTPPRPGRTRWSPRLRFYCNLTQVRLELILFSYNVCCCVVNVVCLN